MTRPTSLVLVVGTATDIGKTWVTAALLTELRSRGIATAARKPVQSFDAGVPEPTDAEVLASAGGEIATEVCPQHRWYEVPMAPPMAAEKTGAPVPHLDELTSEIAWPAPPPSVGFVEGVGGVRSPLADDGDNCNLAVALRPNETLLVGDAGLGTIDSVRLAVDALRAALPNVPVTVFLNRFDAQNDLHLRNSSWLSERDGFDVETSVTRLAARFCQNLRS